MCVTDSRADILSITHKPVDTYPSRIEARACGDMYTHLLSTAILF